MVPSPATAGEGQEGGELEFSADLMTVPHKMKKTIINARKLRKTMTDAERKLWHILRRRYLQNFRFRKQVPLGPYIVDFLCKEKHLIIELDGGQHADAVEYDNQRTQWLEKRGYRVIRFWNNEVLTNLEGVAEVILMECNSNYPLPDLPPQAGAGTNRQHSA